MCKNTLEEESETLINKVSQSKTLERSATLVDKSSEASETLISKASKTLVNHEISSTSLSHTLLPFPVTEQFQSVAEDLKLDRTSSITLAADPRNNLTQLVSVKEDSMTLVDPSSTTILANPQAEKELLLECAKIRGGEEGVQFGEALRQVSNNIIFSFSSFCVFSSILAPTGALIVIVCYYWSGRQLFQILSISANIFSFSF